MNIIALILTLLVGLFILLGSILGIVFKQNKKITDFSISIAFGVIITLIAIELIPEILEISLENLGVWKGVLISSILAFLGFVILQQLDMFIPHHEEENHSHKHKCHDERLKHIGIITSVTLIMHNVIEGMGLYVTALSSLKMGLILCIGIGLHNLPMGLVITSTLINEFSKKKIIIISIIVSLSTVLGGLFIFISGINSELIMGLLLAVTLGMLIYIAFFELLDQVLRLEDKKTSLIGILSGIIILIISVLFG